MGWSDKEFYDAMRSFSDPYHTPTTIAGQAARNSVIKNPPIETKKTITAAPMINPNNFGAVQTSETLSLQTNGAISRSVDAEIGWETTLKHWKARALLFMAIVAIALIARVQVYPDQEFWVGFIATSLIVGLPLMLAWVAFIKVSSWAVGYWVMARESWKAGEYMGVLISVCGGTFKVLAPILIALYFVGYYLSSA